MFSYQMATPKKIYKVPSEITVNDHILYVYIYIYTYSKEV